MNLFRSRAESDKRRGKTNKNPPYTIHCTWCSRALRKYKRWHIKKEERDEKKVLTLKQAYRNRMNKIMYTCIRCTAYMRSAAWGLAERERERSSSFPFYFTSFQWASAVIRAISRKKDGENLFQLFFRFPLLATKRQLTAISFLEFSISWNSFQPSVMIVCGVERTRNSRVPSKCGHLCNFVANCALIKIFHYIVNDSTTWPLGQSSEEGRREEMKRKEEEKASEISCLVWMAVVKAHLIKWLLSDF